MVVYKSVAVARKLWSSHVSSPRVKLSNFSAVGGSHCQYFHADTKVFVTHLQHMHSNLVNR
jgi:hypothetical protein